MMGIQKFTKRANPHIIMHRQFMKWISSCMPKSFYLKHKKTKIINMRSKTRCRSLLIQLFMSNFIFPFHSAHFVEENNSLLSLVLHSRAPAFFFSSFAFPIIIIVVVVIHEEEMQCHTLSRFEMRKFEYTKKLLKDILFFCCLWILKFCQLFLFLLKVFSFELCHAIF